MDRIRLHTTRTSAPDQVILPVQEGQQNRYHQQHSQGHLWDHLLLGLQYHLYIASVHDQVPAVVDHIHKTSIGGVVGGGVWPFVGCLQVYSYILKK